MPVADEFKDYSLSALRNHVEWFTNVFPNALWISDYYAIRRANNRITQLQLAAKLGFNIPDTLLTTDSKRAKRFMQQYPSSIVKSISSRGMHLRNKAGELVPSFFFSHKVDRNDQIDLTNLFLAPSIFQQTIDTKADLRVTVVGKQVFTAMITNEDLDQINEAKGIHDWRIGHAFNSIKITSFDGLPKKIENACIAHVKEQGLLFGAIDLVLDKQDKVWFLENNPNGQWAFVEDETKQPIGKAIADLLLSKQR